MTDVAQGTLAQAIKLRTLKSRDDPGLASGLNVITRVPIRGRREGQRGRREDRSRGLSEAATSRGMWAAPGAGDGFSPIAPLPGRNMALTRH